MMRFYDSELGPLCIEVNLSRGTPPRDKEEP